MIKSVKVQELPAGKYVIGDPCYFIPDQDWGDLLDATDYLNNGMWFVTGSSVGMGFYMGAHGTAYGDGVYDDQYNNQYGVDAGLLGAVPYEVAVKACGEDEIKRLGTVFEFVNSFIVDSTDDGTVIIGRVHIQTGLGEEEYYDDDEDDDWRYEDDGQPDEAQEWYDFDPDC